MQLALQHDYDHGKQRQIFRQQAKAFQVKGNIFVEVPFRGPFDNCFKCFTIPNAAKQIVFR